MVRKLLLVTTGAHRTDVDKHNLALLLSLQLWRAFRQWERRQVSVNNATVNLDFLLMITPRGVCGCVSCPLFACFSKGKERF